MEVIIPTGTKAPPTRYHAPDCKGRDYYRQAPVKVSVQYAQRVGMKPCRLCNPGY